MFNPQYLALSETTLRDELNAVPVYFGYPVKGSLQPTIEYIEETRAEFRGADTAQGETANDLRVSSSWKYSLDGRIYPGTELLTLFKYVFGTGITAESYAAPNAAATRYIFKSTSEVYGDSGALQEGALALIPMTYMSDGGSNGQQFLGGRPYTLEMSFTGGASAEMKIGFSGGPWIGPAADVAVIEDITLPSSIPLGSRAKIYMGSIDITGTDNVTDFTSGIGSVMARPDDISIKIDSGFEDVTKLNGIEGPSITERKKPWMVTIEFTHDFADPAAGWSSFDAWQAQLIGPGFTQVMLEVDSPEIIPGCTTQIYQMGLLLAAAKITLATPDSKTDGSKPKIKVTIESRLDPTFECATYFKFIC